MNDAERETLERRIDELCAEVEYDRQTSRSRLERIDQLKDENTKLCARIDELCAEVERLKGKLSESLDGSYALEVENLRLSDENFKLQQHLEAEKQRNAKLRELVSGLEYCAQGHVCDCCPLYDPSGTNRRRCESLERELGIEVDE